MDWLWFFADHNIQIYKKQPRMDSLGAFFYTQVPVLPKSP